MAEGQADREVIFRLRAETDPRSDAAFEHMGKRSAETQAKLVHDARRGSSARLAATERGLRSEVAAEQRAAAERQQIRQGLGRPRVAEPTASSAGRRFEPAESSEPSQQPARSPDLKSPYEQAQRFAERYHQKADELRQSSDRAAVVSARRQLAAREKALANESQMEKARVAESATVRSKQVDTAEKLAKKQAGSTVTTQQKAADSLQKTLQKRSKEHEQAMDRLDGANRRLTDSFHAGSEGALKLMRGALMVGVVGEESFEKLARKLIKIQATVDLVRGGLEVWRAMSDGAKAFALVNSTAQAAEIAARRANIGLINAETTALGRKAVANTAASGAGGVGKGGVVRSLAGRAAGAVGGIAKAGLVVAKLGAVALVATEGIQAVRRGLGDTSKSSESIVGALLSWRRAAADAKKSTEELSRAENKRHNARAMGEARAKTVRADAERDDKVRQIDTGAFVRGLERQAQQMGLKGDRKDQYVARGRQRHETAGVWDSQRQLDQARQGLATARENHDVVGVRENEARVEVARQAAIAASDRMVSATQERLSIEKKVAQTRLDAADRAIQKARQELDARKEAIKTEQQRLMSAKERFGQMSRGEQRELIRIKQRADSGARLSVADAQKLQGLGTRDTERIAKQEFSRRGDEGGFGQHFGGGERQEINRLKREAEKLTVEIRDKRELRVTVLRDDSALAARLRQTIAHEMEVRDERLIELIEQGNQRTKSEINRQLEFKRSTENAGA
jgi:hypothetical protein